MDRFTRNYLIVFGAVVGGLVLWWGIANWQPQVWRLNGLLDDEPTLAAFSYRFRVLELVDGVASVTTPRTAEMPAARFLGILRPELAGRREDDAALIAAERQLAAVQGRARELLLAQPDVREVRWVLDRDWYLQRGVKP
jgi:hypothetical protein